jgi:hypothetical protein
LVSPAIVLFFRLFTFCGLFRAGDDLMKELRADVLIVGGSLGGCAAALAASQAGFKVILTEETDWLGGQLTSQAVPPDEHGWIERMGCTRSYRRLREGVRAYYRKFYPLTPQAKSDPFFNPGTGWVSPLCHEPKAALFILEALFAPLTSSGRLIILREHKAIAADTAGDRVRAIKLRDLRSGAEKTISARYFLDATELGDLLPLTGTEFVTGAESRAQTGEPNAKDRPEPRNVQAFSVCFALSYHPGEDHTIEKPINYEFWRDYEPKLTPAWPGKLFSWTISNPRTLQPQTYHFDPEGETGRAFSGLWTYRRILDRKNFQRGFMPSDITLMNVPMLDYLEGDITCADEEERRRHIERAREQSLSFLYWLQTEAPRPTGGYGFPELKLRADVVGYTSDGLAKAPYIRESRRICAEFTVCEQHVSAALRPRDNRAEQFEDSVGIGYYRIDLHPTCGGDNYLDIASLPFRIPLGALLPVRMENLLPACKNIGTTHITNGCYRLHPVEWNIGEAAGLLAAFCLERNLAPRAVRDFGPRLADFQKLLMRSGIELAWPPDIDPNEGDPHRHAV